MKLNDVTALVTGAASGLGAATAKELAQRGCHVFGLDLGSAIEAAEPSGGITLIPADVTDPTTVQAAIDQSAGGSLPLRLVVNCAGIAPSARTLGRSGPHSLDMFRRVIDINLIGTFTVLSIAAEAIAKTTPHEDGQRGVIINTASIAAYEGQIGQIAYAASKAGIIGLTLTAARDLASVGVRVCTIAPGLVDTPMLASFRNDIRRQLAAGVPFPQRLCRPQEYAQLVTMIAEHNYLNGETIRMDGALRMAPR